MIEDKELRDIFKIESEEHSQRLDEGLLRLETNPSDAATLDEMFREAHSLKGAARMLGLNHIEAIAHRFEDILNAAKRGKTGLSPEMTERLYRGVDAIRKLVHEAVTGEAAGLDIANVLAQLSGENEGGERKAEKTDEAMRRGEDEEEKTEASSPHPLIPSSPHQSFPPSAFKIDTIRVETQKLDKLMTQVGELSVTKTRIVRQLAEIEEIMALWEEWNRDALSHRFLLSEIESDFHKSEIKSLKRLVNFQERQREGFERLGSLLNQLKSASYDYNTRLDSIANELEEGVRAIRLLPLSTIFELFPRMVRDLAKEQSKEVQLIIEGEETTADKRIIEEMKDPLMHIIRNAIHHGIETPEERIGNGKARRGSIRLKAHKTEAHIVIEVADDGRGLNLEEIKRTALKRRLCGEEELAAMTLEQIQALIFIPGFSTSSRVTDVSGRGVGLDVVRQNVEQLKGRVQVESAFGVGCKIGIQLPITLATARVFIVAVNNRLYAIPVEFVQTSRWVSPSEIFSLEGRETISFEGHPMPIAWLSELLEGRKAELKTEGARGRQNEGATKTEVFSPSEINSLSCMILSIGEEKLGLLVEALIDEQEVILKPLGAILKRVRNVSGATILGTGEICVVLSPQDLMKSSRNTRSHKK